MNQDSLPKNAKQVFKGQWVEVWQWEQELYDGSTAIFERLKRADSAVIIPVVGDKILILDEEQPARKPFTTVPAGQIDKGEEPLNGARRELAEETGHTSNDWQLWRQYDPWDKIVWTVYVFIARNCRQTQAPSPDHGEKITSRLVSFDDFLKMPDDSKFHDGPLREWLLRIRFDQKERAAFFALLFGKK